MVPLSLVSKVVKVLRSADSPAQVGWGFALGAIPGLTPFWALHNILVILLICILNVNISAAFLGWGLFSLFAYLLDPLFDLLGYQILVNIPSLQPLWTWLYNVPIAPLTRFNNTVVMGSLVVALVMLVPNYAWFRWFVRRFRESWGEKIGNWKVARALRGSSIVQLYLKIRDFGG
ncbi:MAG: TIGR03546 family protein [candidate division KSB1 bacterium]|nr:TIGR03546 family protein [candidate division KSB1 bacterium]